MTERLVRTPITPDLVRGAVELEPTEQGLLPHRLPGWARAQIPDDQLAQAESQPAGVRLVFRTAATTVELDGWRPSSRTSAHRRGRTVSTTSWSTAAWPVGGPPTAATSAPST